jgi:hypothetical protein
MVPPQQLQQQQQIGWDNNLQHVSARLTTPEGAAAANAVAAPIAGAPAAAPDGGGVSDLAKATPDPQTGLARIEATKEFLQQKTLWYEQPTSALEDVDRIEGGFDRDAFLKRRAASPPPDQPPPHPLQSPQQLMAPPYQLLMLLLLLLLLLQLTSLMLLLLVVVYPLVSLQLLLVVVVSVGLHHPPRSRSSRATTTVSSLTRWCHLSSFSNISSLVGTTTTTSTPWLGSDSFTTWKMLDLIHTPGLSVYKLAWPGLMLRRNCAWTG